jgi:hypothetical protein
MSHQPVEFPRILARWQAVKDRDLGLLPNCCVLASKVLLVALIDAGFQAWVEPTYALAINKEGYLLLDRGVPTSEWPDTAWSVGVEEGGTIDTGSYPGHLVVFCYVDGALTLVDGSAGQFSRPAKQMNVPSTLWFPTPRWPHAASYVDGAWALTYKPAPLGNLHRVANDWTKNWRKHAADMKQVSV